MKTRLDNYLVARGNAETRAKARDAIMRGCVTVDGVTASKAGLLVSDHAHVVVQDDAMQFVSRGGLKLAAALDHFGYACESKTILDVGASTGGFTDVCLQRGAARVYAVDVGHGQLHPRIAADPRVVNLEGCDIRMASAHIPAPCDAIVADVSFMSLSHALAPAMELAAGNSWLIALAKPQFEVGPQHVGKRGIVRDAQAREAAVERLRLLIAGAPGWHVDGVMLSPLAGGSGNIEFLIGARIGD
ncbi:MAG: hypothetical protein RLZ98_1728 [Pseudomonadota bacterium]|jgi:23S rRNA (cytidine1920-2'-O)/16S rRNA (cytidine1409-2'-O)-methyltransferase